MERFKPLSRPCSTRWWLAGRLETLYWTTRLSPMRWWRGLGATEKAAEGQVRSSTEKRRRPAILVRAEVPRSHGVQLLWSSTEANLAERSAQHRSLGLTAVLSLEAGLLGSCSWICTCCRGKVMI